ncbi:hypothetical protein [Bacillus sp. B-jedd]|uniref:hypothetical protein n=1 Tax=Bacillus sp. B-jedd TaxID=1476857 RepID=UPI0005156950|nr:hypothetical protein [Bacillus sp. B-jedd]CEG29380.1 hypothetical protein BN1002_04318 [Bacillus sp. B-jedd]
MRKVNVLILTVVFLLTMAMPAMAQGKSTVYKGSFQGASFYATEGTTDTYVDLSTNFEGKNSYILYYQTYDYEKDEIYYGIAEIPATKAVFDVNKGTAKVNQTVDVFKVNFTCDEEGECTEEESPAGTKSLNLTWKFNPKSYSTFKYTDKNVPIDFNEFIKLSKGTFKDYYQVSVTGTIGGKKTDSYEYSSGSVTTGSSFTIIK